MLEDADLDPKVAAAVASIRTAAERCAKIVKTFLAMARKQAPTRVPVRIDAGRRRRARSSGLRPRERRHPRHDSCAGGPAPDHGRSGSADPGADQPRHQCPAGDGRLERQAGARHQRRARPPPRPDPDHRQRQRPRHPRRGARPHLRSVLHHQAGRRRHRHRPRGLSRHRRGARRHDHGGRGARRRRLVRGHPAGRRHARRHRARRGAGSRACRAVRPAS